jgi:hypothetical protein
MTRSPRRSRLACPPRRRAVRVTSMVASKLEARSGQRRNSWRNAAVSASIAMSLMRAEESRYTTGELLVTLTVVVRLRAAVGCECRGRRGARAEVERVEQEQIALSGAHAQLGYGEMIRG